MPLLVPFRHTNDRLRKDQCSLSSSLCPHIGLADFSTSNVPSNIRAVDNGRREKCFGIQSHTLRDVPVMLDSLVDGLYTMSVMDRVFHHDSRRDFVWVEWNLLQPSLLTDFSLGLGP